MIWEDTDTSIQPFSLPDSVMPYCTILYYTTILDFGMLHHAILHYTTRYYTILYYTILYYTVPYYPLLYCTIAFYTTQCHAILHKNNTILYFSELHGSFAVLILYCVPILDYTRPTRLARKAPRSRIQKPSVSLL